MKKHIRFEWDDTGSIDIETFGNQSAIIRYAPSDQAIKKAASKLSKNAHNQFSEEAETLNNQDKNNLQKEKNSR